MTAEQIRKKLMADVRVRLTLALEMGVTERTVLNWAKSNSKKLQTPAVVKALKK